MSRVIVVGGGAAGMMAACAAAEGGGSVCLIEKNGKLGKKLFITGKGRCNVTNAADMETLFENVCTNGKFLYSAFYDYDNRTVMNFFERAGCPLKIERGERVFPVSDHASDVTAAFARELRRLGVEVMLNTAVRSLMTERRDGEERERTTGVRLSDGRELTADKVIVCTGGLSYPSTGSTGDGYRFAEESGHGLTERKPALVPLNIREKWCAELMGLSLKNVGICMERGGKTLYQGFGEMLFTHFGVSGPLILSASSFYYGGNMGRKNTAQGRKDIAQGAAGRDGGEREETKLYVDLKPALDEEQLNRRVLRDFEENKNRQFKNSLRELFPARLIPVMVEQSGIHPDRKVNEITREERGGFVRLIKRLPLTVSGTRGFEEAIVTRGGVSVRDVNPSTMESKKVHGLYFAGEVLDLDALTGGFNLQIAWSTGHLAGYSAASERGAE